MLEEHERMADKLNPDKKLTGLLQLLAQLRRRVFDQSRALEIRHIWDA
jgi:hypothetical protein